MGRQEALDQYSRALRAGQKYYKAAVTAAATRTRSCWMIFWTRRRWWDGRASGL